MAATDFPDALTRAQWIGRTEVDDPNRDTPLPPVPLFRTEFRVAAPVQRAVLWICGLGYYEVSLNGRKVGDHVLDPIVTQYDQRVRAVCYNVEAELRDGDNVLGVTLGNGWYNCSTAEVWNFETARWRDQPKFILLLEVTQEDGRMLTVASGPAWKVTDGPIRFDALRNGETYDARLEKAGWNSPDYDDHGWRDARVVPGPGGVIEAQTSPPCKVMETLKPVSVTEIRPGTAVYDLGVNIAGWAQLRIAGQAGTEITLRYNDRLLDNGEVDPVENAGFIKSGDFQTDRYILKGEGTETWEPRFTYHGFQYIQVEGFAGPATLDMVRGRVVHTAFDDTGCFETSDPVVNRLQQCTRRSYLSNFVGIPTDCPHREKNGWTGDAQLAAETGLINFDAASSYRQWLQTMADTQRPSGQFPGIVPSAGWGYNWGSGPAWDSAFILIPWMVYLYTGDITAVEIHYDAMRRYLDYCAAMATDHVVDFGLGDWCAVNGATMPPASLTSTGYYYADAVVLAAFARRLGRNADADAFAERADDIRTAFNARFYRGNGIYADGQMTALGCALYQGLVDDAERSAVADRLAEAVRNNDYKPDFGILGAQYVPRALADNGEVETAFRLLTQPDFPGWVHWLRQGATSLWENWDGGSSHNHIMYGDISAWMYHYLAGIRPDPEHPGFRHVRIRPHAVPGLDWVRASHRAPQGTIRSAWTRRGDRVEYAVTLPEGVTGILELPDGRTRELATGETREG